MGFHLKKAEPLKEDGIRLDVYKRQGQRVVRFYDLDGHIIEVGEEMKTVVERFLHSGMTLEEVSVRMDVSVEDLTKLLTGC